MPKGKKPKYQTALQMQEAINDYFAECDRVEYVYDNEGNIKTYKDKPMMKKEPTPYTESGLALFLGFSSPDALRKYIKREQKEEDLNCDKFAFKSYDEYTFRQVITKAMTRIEEYREKALFDKNSVTGAKFALAAKAGWKESSSVDMNVKAVGAIVSPAEAEKRLKELGFTNDK